MIFENEITGETYGILEHIHKARHNAFFDTGEKLKAEAALAKAIETYEKDLLADPRDFYSGVNAVTLRVIRGPTEDEKRLERIVPVVRFAVERTQEPKDDYENYWRIATEFELVCAERDWKAARNHLILLLPINVQPWMRKTTMNNPELQKRARSKEKDTKKIR